MTQAELPAALQEKLIRNLQNCRQKRDLRQAKRLHAYLMQQQGQDLTTHPVLGNYVVPMLAECGGLLDAQRTFDKLPNCHRNLHSWTSLISCYIDHGDPHYAFHLYDKMQHTHQPDRCVYLALLNASSQLKDVGSGRRLHGDIVKRGLENDLFSDSPAIGNTLVVMYGKCSAIVEAQVVFLRLPIRDVVSWNALIAVYAEHKQACEGFQQMQLEGISPDSVTFVCSLKGCATIRDIETGRGIHAEATKRGLESELTLGNTLVDMYTKCSLLAEAHEVLNKLTVRDPITWNALIAGYAEHGLDEKLLDCVKEMQLKGVPADAITFVLYLKACAMLELLETGREIHADIMKRGLESDTYLGNTLVDLYAKCSSLYEAYHVFTGLLVKTAVSWGALIAGYAEHGHESNVLLSFEQMKLEGVLLDPVIFVVCLKACSTIKATERGREIHADIIRRGLENNFFVGNTLVDMYSNCDLFPEAQGVFDRMLDRDAASWDALTSKYAGKGVEEEVMTYLTHMQMSGIGPDCVTFVCSLKTCGIMRALETGQEIHAEVVKRGSERDLYVANTVLDMYSKCGSLAEACHVFDWMPVRDAVSWTATIAGYANKGLDEEVLKCYKQLQLEGVVVDAAVFVLCLKACSFQGDLETGQAMHTELTKKALERELYLGSKLVNMYTLCGSFEAAQEVFDTLDVQDAVSSNAMCTGVGKHMLSEEMENRIHQLQLPCMCPDSFMFVCYLNACGDLGAIESGREVHFHTILRGLEGEPYVSSTLVDMYAKCGCLMEAHQVFHHLPIHDVVSWNALIGLSYRGLEMEPGDCLRQMCLEGVSPNTVTFVCILKRGGTVGASEAVKEIHSEAVKRGLEQEVSLGGGLMDAYIKCRLVREARWVFDRLPAVSGNLILWNSLIAGYAEHGLTEEVEECIQQLQVVGLAPDSVTSACCLKACGCIGALVLGQERHADATKRGFEKELLVGSTLVDMYSKCGLLAEARQEFDGLQGRDTASWNAMVSGYSEKGLCAEAWSFFQGLQLEGLSPDFVTFTCILKACCITGALETGRVVHAEVIKIGYDTQMFVGNAMVDMYAKCGAHTEAHLVFDRFPVRDAALWNALIGGYADQCLDKEVLDCFKQMQLDGVSMDAVTLVCCLKSCGNLGAPQIGIEVHKDVRKARLEKDLYVGSALVDMYGKCGLVTQGRKAFDGLSERDVVSWTTMIKAYGENHEGIMAVQCFEDMQKHGVKPDVTTFTCLLAACSHASLVLEGAKYFNAMREKHGIEPSMEHYACMVDVFARSGHIYEAEGLVAEGKCFHCGTILVTLLSACKIYGEVQSGERCFQQLMVVNQNVATACVLMAQIYASARRWTDAIKLEEMKGSGQVRLSVEVNEKSPKFSGVFGQHRSLKSIKPLSTQANDKVYVPSVGSAFYEKNKAMTYESVDKCTICLTGLKSNIVFDTSYDA